MRLHALLGAAFASAVAVAVEDDDASDVCTTALVPGGSDLSALEGGGEVVPKSFMEATFKASPRAAQLASAPSDREGVSRNPQGSRPLALAWSRGEAAGVLYNAVNAATIPGMRKALIIGAPKSAAPLPRPTRPAIGVTVGWLVRAAEAEPKALATTD